MYKELYDWMVHRIGEKAAKAGLRLQYSYFLNVVVLVLIALGLAAPTNWQSFLIGAMVFLLVSVVYWVYASVNFAAALSEYFGKEVKWYQLPRVNSKRLFNLWLDKITDPIASTPVRIERSRSTGRMLLLILLVMIILPFVVHSPVVLTLAMSIGIMAIFAARMNQARKK